MFSNTIWDSTIWKAKIQYAPAASKIKFKIMKNSALLDLTLNSKSCFISNDLQISLTSGGYQSHNRDWMSNYHVGDVVFLPKTPQLAKAQMLRRIWRNPLGPELSLPKFAMFLLGLYPGRTRIAPHRRHSTFSTPPPSPNPNVFSITRKSWNPSQHSTRPSSGDCFDISRSPF